MEFIREADHLSSGIVPEEGTTEDLSSFGAEWPLVTDHD